MARVETAGTPAANNVNLLVETVVLNYMALHGEQALFPTANYFPGHGLGSCALRDSLTAFNPIVNGTIISAPSPRSARSSRCQCGIPS
jgi:hypothetical protein